MHLEIVVLSVNCMFRFVMEVELNSGESIWATPVGVNEPGSESLSLLAIFVDCSLGGVAVPGNLDITSLVGVHLLPVVTISIDGCPSTALQINRALVCSSAVVVFN